MAIRWWALPAEDRLFRSMSEYIIRHEVKYTIPQTLIGVTGKHAGLIES